MYDTKSKSYHGSIRKPLLDFIPLQNRNGTTLEIGAGSGDNLIYAKKNGYAKVIYGIELVEIDGSFQKSNEFEQFIIGNIEHMELNFKNELFDVIVMGDVLEHLVDPYSIIREMKKYLTPNGVFVASIPNIRNLKTFRNIFVRGSFKYEDEGIFDRTHLRFFTKKNMIELFENNDCKVQRIKSSLEFKSGSVAFKNKITFGIFEEFLASQYYILAKNDPTSFIHPSDT
jgi:SAM-dependent methyltransferase